MNTNRYTGSDPDPSPFTADNDVSFGSGGDALTGASPENVIERDSLQLVPRTAEERHLRIAERAYALAQCRGFAAGCELDDWLEAEQNVDRLP